jgi:putative Ca2+/H+ antiporter (TMEM165/GDT1 family)
MSKSSMPPVRRGGTRQLVTNPTGMGITLGNVGNAGLLVACFVSVFLAELPDKTSLMIMTLANRGRIQVWLGASLALVVQAGLAVVAGVVLARLVGPFIRWVEVATFTGFALYLWREASEEEEPKSEAARRSAFAAAFLLVFLAEFGDLTQFSIVAWSARLNAPWLTLALSSVALAAAAAVSATVGGYLAERLGVPRLKRLSAVLFVGIAAVMAAA